MGVTIHSNEIPILLDEIKSKYDVKPNPKYPDQIGIETPDGAWIHINTYSSKDGTEYVDEFEMNYTSAEKDFENSNIFNQLYSDYEMMDDDAFEEYLHSSETIIGNPPLEEIEIDFNYDEDDELFDFIRSI